MEGADRVAGQLRGDKECPFSGVTKSGRVWRKVPESGARKVWPTQSPHSRFVEGVASGVHLHAVFFDQEAHALEEGGGGGRRVLAQQDVVGLRRRAAEDAVAAPHALAAVRVVAVLQAVCTAGRPGWSDSVRVYLLCSHPRRSDQGRGTKHQMSHLHFTLNVTLWWKKVWWWW